MKIATHISSSFLRCSLSLYTLYSQYSDPIRYKTTSEILRLCCRECFCFSFSFVCLFYFVSFHFYVHFYAAAAASLCLVARDVFNFSDLYTRAMLPTTVNSIADEANERNETKKTERQADESRAASAYCEEKYQAERKETTNDEQKKKAATN